jgi:hypothetical protein
LGIMGVFKSGMRIFVAVLKSPLVRRAIGGIQNANKGAQNNVK